MATKVYDSGELTGLTDSNPLVVNHNLGRIPQVYSVYRVVSGSEIGWEGITPSNSGVYVDSFTANQAVIKCASGYTFSGNCKLVCFD